MSSHGHGGHEGGHEPAPAPAAPKAVENKSLESDLDIKALEKEKIWARAQLERGFNDFLDDHENAAHEIDAPGTSLEKKMEWYEFYTNIKVVKNNLKKVLEDRIATLRQNIRVGATQASYDALDAEIDKLAKKDKEGGRDVKEIFKELVRESEEYFDLRKEANKKREELDKTSERYFPRGGRERLAECASAYMELVNRRKALQEATEKREVAEKKVMKATHMSAGLFWTKKAEKQKAVDKAEEELVEAQKACDEAGALVKAQEKQLYDDFHVGYQKMDEMGDEIARVQMESEVLYSSEIRISDLQYKLPALNGKFDAGITEYINYVTRLSNEALLREAGLSPTTASGGNGGGGPDNPGSPGSGKGPDDGGDRKPSNPPGGASVSVSVDVRVNTGSEQVGESAPETGSGPGKGPDKPKPDEKAAQTAEAGAATTAKVAEAVPAQAQEAKTSEKAEKKFINLLHPNSINNPKRKEHLKVKVGNEEGWKVRKIKGDKAEVYKPAEGTNPEVVKEVSLKDLEKWNQELTKVEKKPGKDKEKPAAKPAAAPEAAKPAAAPEAAKPAAAPEAAKPAESKEKKKDEVKLDFGQAMQVREAVQNYERTDKGYVAGTVQPSVEFVGPKVLATAIDNRVKSNSKELLKKLEQGQLFEVGKEILIRIDTIVKDAVGDGDRGSRQAYEAFRKIFADYINDNAGKLHKVSGKEKMLRDVVKMLDKKIDECIARDKSKKRRP